MKTSEKHQRRRLVIAPPPSHPGLHSAVLNVECADDKDVQRLWTETPDGRLVTGYRLIPRLKLPRTGREFCAPSQSLLCMTPSSRSIFLTS
jgi:hypothetical protein